MVVAYRWIQNDEKRSKIHIKKCGTIVLEINETLGYTGGTESQNFMYLGPQIAQIRMENRK